MSQLDYTKMFDQYCCVNRILSTMDAIKGKEHLINSTLDCFNGINITRDQQFNIIIHFFRNSTFPYTEGDCKQPTPRCLDPVQPASIVYVVFWVFLLILTVCSNTLVIVAVQRVSFLKQNIANLFISSLAMSDLLVGLFVIPLKISSAYHNLRFCHSNTVCRIHVTTDNAFFSASITNLFIITVDRYIALNHPYRYPSLMTSARCKIIIVLVWLYGCIWGSLINFKWERVDGPAIYVENYGCRSSNFIYSCAIFTLVFYIPVLVMGVLYFRIFSIARYHAKSISEAVYYSNNNMNNNNNEVCEDENRCSSPDGLTGKWSPDVSRYNKRYNVSAAVKYKKNDIPRSASKGIQVMQYRRMMLKAVKTIATVYGTFVICWLPVSILSIIEPLCPHCFNSEKEIRWSFIIFVQVLPIVNSTLNPFIYAMMNKQYRQAFKELLGCLPCFCAKKKQSFRAHANTTLSTTTVV